MKSKLVWFGFDPFQKEQKTQRNALRTAVVYAKAISAKIEPVYFADRYRGTDAGSYLFPLFPSIESASLSEMETIAIDSWESLAKSEKIKTLPLRILTHTRDQVPSLDSKAKALSKAAKRAGVEFIVLQTRATSGLKRLVLGSFAETFLLNASVPALMIPPDAASTSKPKHLLFFSDLSATSFLAFKKMIPVLKALKVEVSLLYYLELPISLVLTLKPSERRIINTKQLIESARPDLEEKAKDFLDLARAYKLKMNFEIRTDVLSISKAEAVLGIKDRLGADCIALASQSGELSTALLGAMSRTIVRSANCPIFIFRASN